jgi:serine/threonine-protein kinase
VAVTEAKELAAGVPLERLLAPGRALPWRPVTAAIARVAESLLAIHNAGRVHGGVQPDAITITEISIELGPPAAKADPRYAAPERVDDPDRDPAAPEDVFALGVIWYQMLTGRLPWRTDSPHELLRAHMWVAPDPLPESVDMPRRLNELCLECLGKEPWQRPDATELVAALATIRDKSLLDDGPAPARARRTSVWRLILLWLAVIAGAIVLVAAIVRQAGAVDGRPSPSPSGGPSSGAPGSVPLGPSSASAAAGQPTPSGSPGSGPGPSLGPPGPGPSGSVPSASTLISTSPSASPKPTVVTVTGIGGFARMECVGTDRRMAHIRLATPATGYVRTFLDAGPAHQVHVRFENGESRTDIYAVCTGGVIAPRVIET